MNENNQIDRHESDFTAHDHNIPWYVWCPENGAPTVCHGNSTDARDEARRLAQRNPGKTFIVLRADSSYTYNSIRAVHYG